MSEWTQKCLNERGGGIFYTGSWWNSTTEMDSTHNLRRIVWPFINVHSCSGLLNCETFHLSISELTGPFSFYSINILNELHFFRSAEFGLNNNNKQQQQWNKIRPTTARRRSHRLKMLSRTCCLLVDRKKRWANMGLLSLFLSKTNFH